MPQHYVYVCPQCGATSGQVTALPESWFSVSLPASYAAAGTMTMEFFDTWNCVSVYAQAQAAAPADQADVS